MTLQNRDKRGDGMVQNLIRIDGEFKKQEEIPVEQMREVSRVLAVRFAEGLGYIPVRFRCQCFSHQFRYPLLVRGPKCPVPVGGQKFHRAPVCTIRCIWGRRYRNVLQDSTECRKKVRFLPSP